VAAAVRPTFEAPAFRAPVGGLPLVGHRLPTKWSCSVEKQKAGVGSDSPPGSPSSLTGQVSSVDARSRRSFLRFGVLGTPTSGRFWMAERFKAPVLKYAGAHINRYCSVILCRFLCAFPRPAMMSCIAWLYRVSRRLGPNLGPMTGAPALRKSRRTSSKGCLYSIAPATGRRAKANSVIRRSRYQHPRSTADQTCPEPHWVIAQPIQTAL
jgi:hypothetical protein